MGTDGKTGTVLEVGKVAIIKYEKVDKFKTSVFYNVYKNAFDITQEIINDNQIYQQNYSQNTNGTNLRNSEQIYNIIFFTGDRGAGKTSAMLSYMEFLKDYYRNANNPNKDIGELVFSRRDIMFTGLEYIDASSLTSKEDILGSVLSKMLKKWKDEEKRSYGERGIRREDDYTYKKRQIHMRFNEVYENVKKLRSTKDVMETESDMFMETLESMSITWNLQQSFQHLVKEYLDVMEYPGSEKQIGRGNHFLVISIDDLDMNVESGFELMEQIRRYLMGPNVLVLLSANYEQLEKICYNYYISKFEKAMKHSDMDTYCMRLSRDYLEKIIPVQRQVVLYSGGAWDYFGSKPLTIQYKMGETDSGPTEEEKKNNKWVTGTVEDIVKDDMKKYFGVDLLQNGKCLWYLSPNTLREVCDWIGQTRRNLVACNRKTDIAEYEKNLQWFWKTEFPWLLKEYMQLSEKMVFDNLEFMDTDGKLRYMKEVLEERGKDGLSVWELFGQISRGIQEEQCLAAIGMLYFSVKISENLKRLEYLRAQISREKEQGKGDRQQSELDKQNVIVGGIKDYFRTGIWGRWEEKMIPKMRKTLKTNESLFVHVNYLTQKIEKGFRISLQGSKPATIKAIDEFISRNKKTLIDYQYLLLFFDIDGNHNTIKWLMEESGNEVSLRLEKNYQGRFCLSNVFLNLQTGAKLVEYFTDSLIDILFSGITGRVEKKIKLRTEISILEDTGEDVIGKYLYKALVPVGNIEYVVELGRMMEAELKNDMKDDLTSENIQTIICKFFDIIEKSLEGTEYLNDFKKCAPIKQILLASQTIKASDRLERSKEKPQYTSSGNQESKRQNPVSEDPNIVLMDMISRSIMSMVDSE